MTEGVFQAGILPEGILEWIRENPALLEVALIVSVVTFVGSLVALPFLVSAIPEDYFAQHDAPQSAPESRHPMVRLVLVAAKNILGALLLLAGFAMLVLPGQGILTILIGLSLLSFPGKRAIELSIVRRPSVLRVLNWFRAKRGKPPLRIRH